MDTSLGIIRSYCKDHRKGSHHVEPQQVIDVLEEAGIKCWVLMGLYGYVGHLDMLRATQDVNVMVPYSQKSRAAKAVGDRLPMLRRVNLSQVVRFLDDTDIDPEGNAKPVVDVTLPWGKLQETILEKCVILGAKTKSRYPMVEASLASKYAALISPNRSRDKKEQYVVDFRRIVRANHERVREELLRELADQIWDEGGESIMRFIDLTLRVSYFRFERIVHARL